MLHAYYKSACVNLSVSGNKIGSENIQNSKSQEKMEIYNIMVESRSTQKK